MKSILHPVFPFQSVSGYLNCCPEFNSNPIPKAAYTSSTPFKPMTESPIVTGKEFHEITGFTVPESSLRPFWDVFINHRGKDCKKNLASLLHYHLGEVFNLTVFLDEKGLELGDMFPEEIVNAILSARVHIAIFSENYPKSPWCLAELSLMLKSRAAIVPIFYDLQPSDLRRDSQLHVNCFKMHRDSQKFNAQLLEQWQGDLHTASYMQGLVFNSQSDDSGILLKDIYERVFKEVKKTKTFLSDATHLVGLHEAIEDFERKMLHINQKNVEVVGIVGMPGVGKTTMAMELFDRKQLEYDRTCFLFNVGETSKKGLELLQSKLIQELLHFTWDIQSIDEGKQILRKYLKGLRVFIVLDNINQKIQLDSLLVKDDLGPGSLILVTSRDKGVLKRSGIFKLYPQKLNAKHAKELFCQNAFNQHQTMNGFENLVEEVLTTCDGLPLFLKECGEHFHASDNKSNWKIPRMQCDQRDVLRVIYDALQEQEKRIFLEIALIYEGKDKSTAIGIWDELRMSGSDSLETLEEKCVVEVDDKHCLKMHSQFRELAKDIAYEEHFKDPYNVSQYRFRQKNIRYLLME